MHRPPPQVSPEFNFGGRFSGGICVVGGRETGPESWIRTKRWKEQDKNDGNERDEKRGGMRESEGGKVNVGPCG